MKILSKIVFISAVALSAISPAFAYESALEYQTQMSNTGTRAHHVMGKRNAVRAHRGIDASAYAPVDAPAGQVRDFGIGGPASGGAL